MQKDLALFPDERTQAAWRPVWLLATALLVFAASVALGLVAMVAVARVAQGLGVLDGAVRIDMFHVRMASGVRAGTVVALFTLAGLATQAVLVAGAIVPARRASGLSVAAAIGLRRPHGLPAGALLALALAVVLYAFAADAVLTAWHGSSGLRWTFMTMGTTALPYLLVLSVGAPLAEEFLFRGWLLAGLLRHWRPWSAILVSGLFWADLHMFADPLKALLLFAPGILFAWLRVRTGSIWPPVMLHMLLNSFAIFLSAVR